jgi:dipeptidyl aminopeptidase/acylaminoacyl peptidase
MPHNRGAAMLETTDGRVIARLRPRVDDLSMSATWSPDGRLLAVADQQDETRSRFRVRLLDARTGRVLGARIVRGGEPVLARASFAPAGDRLVFALADPRRPPVSRTERG